MYICKQVQDTQGFVNFNKGQLATQSQRFECIIWKTVITKQFSRLSTNELFLKIVYHCFKMFLLWINKQINIYVTTLKRKHFFLILMQEQTTSKCAQKLNHFTHTHKKRIEPFHTEIGSALSVFFKILELMMTNDRV